MMQWMNSTWYGALEKLCARTANPGVQPQMCTEEITDPLSPVFIGELDLPGFPEEPDPLDISAIPVREKTNEPFIQVGQLSFRWKTDVGTLWGNRENLSEYSVTSSDSSEKMHTLNTKSTAICQFKGASDISLINTERGARVINDQTQEDILTVTGTETFVVHARNLMAIRLCSQKENGNYESLRRITAENCGVLSFVSGGMCRIEIAPEEGGLTYVPTIVAPRSIYDRRMVGGHDAVVTVALSSDDAYVIRVDGSDCNVVMRFTERCTVEYILQRENVIFTLPGSMSSVSVTVKVINGLPMVSITNVLMLETPEKQLLSVLVTGQHVHGIEMFNVPDLSVHVDYLNALWLCQCSVRSFFTYGRK